MAEHVSEMSGKLAMFTGVLGALWTLALVVVGGAAVPGYDHASQFISELGATGMPHGPIVSWAGFLPIGILTSAFAFFAWRATPRSVLSTLGFVGVFLFAIGYVGSAFFPCDYGCRPEEPSASQMLHNLLGLAGYLFAPLTLLLLALASRAWPKANTVSLVAFVAAGVSLLAIVTLSEESDLVGVSQRALEASVQIWVAVCGLYLGLRPRAADRSV